MTAQRHNILHYIFVILYNLIKGITSSLLWLFLATIGYLIFKTQSSPLGVVVGIPLILAGGGLIINNLATVLQAIFSPTYNKGVCTLCQK